MSSGKIIALVLAVVGLLGVLMVALCGGALYLGYQTASNSAAPQIDHFLDAIAEGTFADTYESDTTSEYRAVTTKEQHADIGKAIAARLGRLESKSLQRFNMQQMNASSFMDVTYSAKFEKGSATISARLKNEGGKWKFVKFQVQSPEFQKDLSTAVCSKCGAPHAADARFCPQCGASLTEGSQSTEEPAESAAK